MTAAAGVWSATGFGTITPTTASAAQVRALQYLLQLADGTTAAETTWTTVTTARLQHYQQSKGLPVTGVADPATLNRLTTDGPVKPGINSVAVTAAQTLLNAHGYAFDPTGAGGAVRMSTLFNADTRNAVIAFNARHGLGYSAVVGARTWMTLFATPSPSGPDATYYPGTRNTAGATTRIDVAGAGHANTAQTGGIRYLLLAADIGTNGETTWGSSTTMAVMAFQAKVGLPVTGAVNDTTFVQLMRTVGTGSTSYAVYALQALAAQHGHQYTANGTGLTMPMTRTFGTNELNLINTIQARYGMGISSSTSSGVWRTLFSVPAKPEPAPVWRGVTSSSSAPNHYTLTAATVGEGHATAAQTRAVQYLLLYQGITSGWENSYGEATRTALTAFQAKRGLPATGAMDDATLAAIIGPTLTKGTTSYRTYAVQTLLTAHGYAFNASGSGAMPMTRLFDTNTDMAVRAFSTGHGLDYAGGIALAHWRTLMTARTTGPMFPVMQQGTGTAQWANCGPTALLAALLSRGKAVSGWSGTLASRVAAVQYLRYTAMGLPHTSARDAYGTEYPDLAKALTAYGITHHQQTSRRAGLDNVKAGGITILGGDAYQLPWNRGSGSNVGGPVSHWVAVLGWDGHNYLVIDPISGATHNVVHRLSETDILKYSATNPGWQNNPRMAPPELNGTVLP